MKPTLYEALGLSPSAADSEIKAALRRLVRRYYAKTRAGHTDVEEALRFLNHASHVLGNSQRRSDYDSELARGIRTDSSLTTVGELSAHEVAAPTMTTKSDIAISITGLGILPLPDKSPPPDIEAIPAWSAQIVDLRRTRAGQLGGLLAAVLILLAVWKLAVPVGGEGAIIRFAALGLVLTGIAGALLYALVHALSRSVWKLPQPESAATIVEGMIPRWRRDHTVFMGTGGPVEDATWLFRLRMAELKRVSAERVSDPQPWMRLFARIFDYGVWGVFLFGNLGVLQMAGPGAAGVARILSHPLLAPILITTSWIPVEALLLAHTQTTPGRWLMCVYLHYQVSNPYAPEELRFTYDAALRRARDVWWRGCGAGLPLFSMITVARANEHITRAGESRWDSERDCLVTHGPVGTLSYISVTIGLAACALAFSSWWLDPTRDIAASAQRIVEDASGRLAAVRAPTPPPPPGPPSRVARVDDVANPAPPPPVAQSITGETNADPVPDVFAPKVKGSAGSANGSAPASKGPASTVSGSAETIKAPASTANGSAPAAIATAPPFASPRSRQIAVPVPGSNVAESAPPKESANVDAPARPGPLELRDQRIAKYAQQARVQQARGDFAGLARTCQRWADEDWRDPRAFYCLGLGQQGIGLHKEAIATFNKAGSLMSRDDPLYMLISDAVLKSFRAGSEK
jgi:hypothetical protein